MSDTKGTRWHVSEPYDVPWWVDKRRYAAVLGEDDRPVGGFDRGMPLPLAQQIVDEHNGMEEARNVVASMLDEHWPLGQHEDGEVEYCQQEACTNARAWLSRHAPSDSAEPTDEQIKKSLERDAKDPAYMSLYRDAVGLAEAAERDGYADINRHGDEVKSIRGSAPASEKCNCMGWQHKHCGSGLSDSKEVKG